MISWAYRIFGKAWESRTPIGIRTNCITFCTSDYSDARKTAPVFNWKNKHCDNVCKRPHPYAL